MHRPRAISPTSRRPSSFAALFEALEDRRLMSGTLPIGTVVSGSIGEVGAQEQWTLEGHAGQQISWAATSTPTQAGFSAFFELMTPAGERQTYRYGGDYNNVTLEADGTYTIVARDAYDDQTGKYTLCVESLSPASPEPGSLVKGGIVSGAIASSIDMNEWTFDGTAGQIVTLATTSTATQAGFNAFAQVYAPSGERVTYLYPGGRSTLTLSETGRYIVTMCDSDGAQTGKYTIGFEGINTISPNPIKASVGGMTSNAIEANNDVDQLTFSGKAGDIFALAMTSTPTVAGFNALAEVYAPSGTRVGYHYSGGQSFFTLPEDGTYVIDVHDSSYDATGKYTIGLESVNPPSPNPGVLQPGVRRNGANESSIDVDQYTFFATEGDKINLTLTGTATDSGYSAYAEIYDEAGERQSYYYSSWGTSTFTAPRTGTFLVQVHDSSFARRGKYGLTLNWVGGTATGAISGTLFSDKNMNRKMDANESGLKDWVVYVDKNNNKRRDAGELWTTTDFTGAYAFYGLKAGKYNVRAVNKAGNTPTAPKTNVFQVQVKRGQAAIGKNFGFVAKA